AVCGPREAAAGADSGDSGRARPHRRRADRTAPRAVSEPCELWRGTGMSQAKRFATGEIDLAKHDRHAEEIAKRRCKRREKQTRTHKLPRWVYKIILILILSVVGMLLWSTRQRLAPDRVMGWVQDRVVGIGVGDGVPQRSGGTVVETKS